LGFPNNLNALGFFAARPSGRYADFRADLV